MTQSLIMQEPRPMNGMEMVHRAFEAAIASGAGLEVVDRLIAQQREMMEYNDRTAFQAALRRIQDELKPIAKDLENKETHSRYASAEKVDEAIDRLLSRERMSLSFEPEPHPQVDMLRIVGVLSLGAYSKRYPLDVPADGKGAKGGGVMSRTHATGSAITYGKRYLKNMIFNLRFKEKDDDGNAAGISKRMDDSVIREWLDHIATATNSAELTARYIQALKAANTTEDKHLLEDAANKRKKDLAK